jgi:hypothetical protein
MDCERLLPWGFEAHGRFDLHGVNLVLFERYSRLYDEFSS